jgi:hypothetical protein
VAKASATSGRKSRPRPDSSLAIIIFLRVTRTDAAAAQHHTLRENGVAPVPRPLSPRLAPP